MSCGSFGSPPGTRAHLGGDREVEEPTAVNPGWRKSSYSDNGGASCVEVGGTVAGVLVRDTTNRAGAVLTIPAAAWRGLLAEIRS
jgi:hypothetical protein